VSQQARKSEHTSTLVVGRHAENPFPRGELITLLVGTRLIGGCLRPDQDAITI
jgi:hypothetical protein